MVNITLIKIIRLKWGNKSRKIKIRLIYILLIYLSSSLYQFVIKCLVLVQSKKGIKQKLFLYVKDEE